MDTLRSIMVLMDGAISRFPKVLIDNARQTVENTIHQPRGSEWRGKMSDSKRIETKCPACGNSGVLFIGEGGWLTCSWISCKDPSAISHLTDKQWAYKTVLEDLDAKAHFINKAIEGLRSL